MRKSPQQRESRKKAAPLPEHPGYISPRITQPKKSNVKAIRRIAAGDYFWDKRKIRQKQTRRRLKEAHAMDYPRAYPLRKPAREEILKHSRLWKYDTAEKVFVHDSKSTPEQLVADFIYALGQTTLLTHAINFTLLVEGEGWSHFEKVTNFNLQLSRALPKGSTVRATTPRRTTRQ